MGDIPTKSLSMDRKSQYDLNAGIFSNRITPEAYSWSFPALPASKTP